eukprot:14279707-Ditylum_brightwellii.AAC.1
MKRCVKTPIHLEKYRCYKSRCKYPERRSAVVRIHSEARQIRTGHQLDIPQSYQVQQSIKYRKGCAKAPIPVKIYNRHRIAN